MFLIRRISFAIVITLTATAPVLAQTKALPTNTPPQSLTVKGIPPWMIARPHQPVNPGWNYNWNYYQPNFSTYNPYPYPMFTPGSISVVTPGYFTGPTWAPAQLTPWGIMPQQWLPGQYVPPMMVTQDLGGYQWANPRVAVNPINGTLYDGWSNTFIRPDGIYGYDPLAGTFRNPFNGAAYNPNTGITVRPVPPGALLR
jgi:hypothetical protein